jgi:hypothetical protein
VSNNRLSAPGVPAVCCQGVSTRHPRFCFAKNARLPSIPAQRSSRRRSIPMLRNEDPSDNSQTKNSSYILHNPIQFRHSDFCRTLPQTFRELRSAVSVERSGKRKPLAEASKMSNQPMGVRAPDSMTPSSLAIDPVLDLSLSSLADTPYSMELNLVKTLDDLINVWCERRALRPLA